MATTKKSPVTSTLKFLKPLLRLLCTKRSPAPRDNSYDAEIAAQNAANEALEAALQSSLHQHHNETNHRLC